MIVVQSQCDRPADRLPDPPRPAGFDFFFFECCAYSAREDLGRDILESHLRDAIRSVRERTDASEIGRGRAELRRRLDAWRSEDRTRRPEERRHRAPSLDEFRALCDEVGGIASPEHALDDFHKTGVVIYRPDLLPHRIVLDPDWVLEAIDAVFHRGRTVSWLRDSGCFTREDLAAMAWPAYSPEEQNLFLHLMEFCHVCFRCGDTAEGEPLYLALDMLPELESVAEHLPDWNETPDMLTLRLEYPFFRPMRLRFLLSEIGEGGYRAKYWKSGFWLENVDWDTQLLARFEDTRTAELPGAMALELRAWGREPRRLLRQIRWMVRLHEWNEEEDPEELLTLNGTTVARSTLESALYGRVHDIQGKLVPAAPFAEFLEVRLPW